MTDIPALQTTQPVKTVTVVSGNLFDIAARYLGDARQWNRVARLNGMADPFFSGIYVLRLPAVDKNASTDGILYG